MSCLPLLFSMEELDRVAPGFTLEEDGGFRYQRKQLAGRQQALQGAIAQVHEILASGEPGENMALSCAEDAFYTPGYTRCLSRCFETNILSICDMWCRACQSSWASPRHVSVHQLTSLAGRRFLPRSSSPPTYLQR